MVHTVIDFSRNQTAADSPLQQPEVIRFLRKSESPFLSSNPFEVQTQYKKSMMGLKKEEIYVRFTHNLVRSGPNQWHVINNKNRGEGGFGAVNESKFKLMVHDKSIELVAVDDVVKIQKPTDRLPKTALLAMAKDEAEFQRQHGVLVYDPIDAGDKIITVLEDCGTSLDKLFPLSSRYDLNYRLAIATRLGSEMLLLQQNNVVHRDLKPSNICLKKLSNGSFQIIFIDFGLSKETSSAGNYEAAGTYVYMAPEILTGRSTPASDMYAFAAILGELFGARDLFKNKQKKSLPSELLNAPYCFDGLFEHFNCSGVDPVLLQDFKKLLQSLSNNHPQLRPTINHVNKFLITIPSRIQEYNNHLRQKGRQNLALEQMDNLLRELTGFTKENIPLNDITDLMRKKQVRIAKSIQELPPPRSHYSLSEYLAENNVFADLSGAHCPFPRLDEVIVMIEQENARLKQCIGKFMNFSLSLTNTQKWGKTNSTGIKKIIEVLNSPLPMVTKLQTLQTIGQDKTSDGFLSFNWYSHLSIFGKGRHRNVEKLYRLLASIDVKSSQFYLAQEQLTHIQDFIERHHFIHGEDGAPQQAQSPV